MKHLIISLMILAVFPLHAQEPDAKTVHSYFNEVALGAEFGDADASIRKWESDMRIFLRGDWPDFLRTELDVVIADLNTLIDHIDIRVVSSKSESNFIIFVGDPHEYVERVEPSAAPYVEQNYGMFWVYWEKDVIYQGSMYVDPIRADTEAWQKHLLREELTQSLGLMQDSKKYDDSIFYQNRSYTTSYSELDKRLIQTLYHPQIKAGMKTTEVDSTLDDLMKKPGLMQKLFSRFK